MTTRQKNMGITNYGLEQAKKGNIINDNESLKAWMSNVKKGQYTGRKIFKMIENEISNILGYEVIFAECQFEDFKCMCKGLAITCPKYFNYTDTLGLDLLTIK